MKKYKLSTTIVGILSLLITGCSIEPVFYSDTVPDTFFESQENVWQRFYRAFTHWKYYLGEERFHFELSNLGTDEAILPHRGSDWINGGDYLNLHNHDFSENTINTNTLWSAITMGIAHAWDTKNDLDKFVDFDAFGFPEGTRESMFNQLNTLAAFYYLEGLNFFGGMPIYRTVGSEVVGRSTAQETFDFIEELLNEAIPTLPMRESMDQLHTGSINRATGAALKARLYFNAEAYIGKAMYEECATICKDIIDGKYGAHKLEEDWTNIFGFNNEYSSEILWSVPSEFTLLESGKDIQRAWNHYNLHSFLGGVKPYTSDNGGYNGISLAPSLKPTGERYEYKLGSPYAKFEDTDVRKQQYVYEGNGKYRGMFIVGELTNPIDGGQCLGAREYTGEVINIVDIVAPLSKVGTAEYPTYADLPSDFTKGEENSGVRLMKLSPMPNFTDNSMVFKPDLPVIRLAEIYYTLAECHMRAGRHGESAILINTVRQRYFQNGDVDPNPVTATNLDDYRMLDEWMIEFLGESRRRTDLIRFGLYHTGEWWAHKPTNNPNINRYPLNYRTLGSNDLLEQNPGYF